MLGSTQFNSRRSHKLQAPGWEQPMFSWVRREGLRERVCAVDPVANWRWQNPLDATAFEHLEETLNDESTAEVSQGLKLLSFNIQVGIKTTAYRQYLTNGWKHLLPHFDRARNLQKIAKLICAYDVVGLQEVDGGSLRSGFVNQVEFLAQMAGFPYWYAQLNRDLGLLAQHGNGLLSRVSPLDLHDHKLPGAIPGRGAVFMRLPFGESEELLVVMLHLSLGERSRQQQLAYIAEQVADEKNVVLMGDMNTSATVLMEESPLKSLSLQTGELSQPTYPAWQPRTTLDHVLVTPSVSVQDYQVLDCQVSDHLPVSVEVAPTMAPPNAVIQ